MDKHKLYKKFPDYSKDIVIISIKNQEIQWKCLVCGECWTTQIDQSKQYQNIVKCPNAKHHNLGYTLDELHELKLNRKLKDVSKTLYNEYDTEHNNKNIDNVTIGDTIKRVWQCQKCGNHWRAAPIERFDAKENKIIKICPKCQKQKDDKIIPRNQIRNRFGLAYQRPQFINYYDKELNDIDLFKIADRQNCKIHWKCYRCGYKWVKPPVQNFPKNVCPACQTRLVQGLNDLGTVQKQMIKHFDFKYNTKKPVDIHYLSKIKLHWKCANCGHTQMVSPFDLYKSKRLCVKCDTVKNKAKHLLKYINDPSLDTLEKVENCRVDSRMIVDWKCDKGHTYKMNIYERINNFYGCPKCRNDNWAYTKLKNEFQERGKMVKELSDFSTNTDQFLERSLLVDNMLIKVIQLYKRKNRQRSIEKEYAIKNNYRYYEVIEEQMDIMQDIQKIFDCFRIPIENQDTQIKQLVEWFIRYGCI